MTNKKPTNVTSGRVVYEPTDPTPVAVPVHLRKPESMDDRIRRIVQHSASEAARMQGLETFEEADDFDIPDDPLDALTPWEADFDLSFVQAVDGGLAQRPKLTPETDAKARGLLRTFRDFVREKTGDRRREEFAEYYHKRNAPPEPVKGPEKRSDDSGG